MKRLILLVVTLVVACVVAVAGQSGPVGAHSAFIKCVTEGSHTGELEYHADSYRTGHYSADGGTSTAFTGGFDFFKPGNHLGHLVVTADDWPTFDATAGPCVQPTTTTHVTYPTTTTTAATTTTVAATTTTVKATTTTIGATTSTSPSTSTTAPESSTSTTGVTTTSAPTSTSTTPATTGPSSTSSAPSTTAAPSSTTQASTSTAANGATTTLPPTAPPVAALPVTGTEHSADVALIALIALDVGVILFCITRRRVRS